MSKTTDVRKLMEKLRAAHSELKQALIGYRTVSVTKQEPGLITAAQNKFQSAYRRLFEEYLVPLDARFRSRDEEAVDEVIAFLAIDVPTIRCGYLKEKWLRRLKSASLSQGQEQRLTRAALSLCASSHYQREIAEWNRLMIKLANKGTVTTLFGLMESDNPVVKSKARHMLHGILQNRNDIIQPDYLRHSLVSHLKRKQ